MRRCCVNNCHNNKSKGLTIMNDKVTYFRFPKKLSLRNQWKDIIGLNTKIDDSTVICHNHFEDNYIYMRAGKQNLLADALPTIFIYDDRPENSMLHTFFSSEANNNEPIRRNIELPTKSDLNQKNCETSVLSRKIAKKLAIKRALRSSTSDLNLSSPERELSIKSKLKIVRVAYKKLKKKNIKLRHILRTRNERILQLEKYLADSKSKNLIDEEQFMSVLGKNLSSREQCKHEEKIIKIVNEPIQDESQERNSSETESVIHEDDYDMENMTQNNLTNSARLNSDIEVEETFQLASAIFNESDEDKDDDVDKKLINENNVTDQNDENTTDNMSDGLLIESDTSKHNHKRQIQKRSNNKLGRKNLTKSAVKLLKNWVYEHRYHAYPSDAEKEMLSRQTGYTLTQISNWFVNARRRILPEYLKGDNVVLGKDEFAHIIKRKKTLENESKLNDESLKPKKIKNVPMTKNIRINEIKNVPITKNIRISTKKFVLKKCLGYAILLKN